MNKGTLSAFGGKKIALLSAAFALAVPLVPVFAQQDENSNTMQIQPGNQGAGRQEVQAQRQEQRDGNQQMKDQNQAERSQLKEQKQQNVQDRCQNIQNKIGERITKVEDNKKNFAVAFDNMQARLERLSDRLATANVDVAKLNDDIKTLSDKIAKLKTDHDAFIAQLTDTQADAPSACGTSQGEFLGKLGSSRKASLTVEQDRLDIRNFYQSTIKPDIMAIRKQLDTQKTTTPESAQ